MTVPSHPASRAARGYSGRGLFPARTLDRTEPASAVGSRNSFVPPADAAGRGRLTYTDPTLAFSNTGGSIDSGTEKIAAPLNAMAGGEAGAGTRGRSLKTGCGLDSTTTGPVVTVAAVGGAAAVVTGRARVRVGAADRGETRFTVFGGTFRTETFLMAGLGGSGMGLTTGSATGSTTGSGGSVTRSTMVLWFCRDIAGGESWNVPNTTTARPWRATDRRTGRLNCRGSADVSAGRVTSSLPERCAGPVHRFRPDRDISCTPQAPAQSHAYGIRKTLRGCNRPRPSPASDGWLLRRPAPRH